MKTLIVCNEKGECVLTLTNANDKYSCTITDVAENQIAIGKDLEANKIITVSKDISDYKKQKLIDELVKKNEAYSNKVELEQVKKVNEELNGELKKEIDVLKQGLAEVGELVFDNISEPESN